MVPGSYIMVPGSYIIDPGGGITISSTMVMVSGSYVTLPGKLDEIKKYDNVLFYNVLPCLKFPLRMKWMFQYIVLPGKWRIKDIMLPRCHKRFPDALSTGDGDEVNCRYPGAGSCCSNQR